MSSHRLARNVHPLRLVLPFVTSVLFLSVAGTAGAADAGLSPGAWVVNGVPSPSGKALVATIADAKDAGLRLRLPKDYLPGMSAEDVLLKQTGPKTYSGALASGGTVSLTGTSPDSARMDLSIAGKKGMGKFVLDLSRAGN